MVEVVGLENQLGNDSGDFIYLFYLLNCTANWMCLVYELVYGSLPFLWYNSLGKISYLKFEAL